MISRDSLLNVRFSLQFLDFGAVVLVNARNENRWPANFFVETIDKGKNLIDVIV
jgi:hypothetical protein